MGRRWMGLLLAMLVFSVGCLGVSAAGPWHKGGRHLRSVCHGWTGEGCGGYADADGNGICDNCGALRSACHGWTGEECGGYADADGNGICDNCGALRSACHGYVGAGGASYNAPAEGRRHHGSGCGSGHGRGCH